jgi:hypothetical protein
VEATWAIANALSNGSPEHVEYMVHQNCIRAITHPELFCELDVQTIDAVLEALEHILELGKKKAFELRGNENSLNPYLKYFESGDVHVLESLTNLLTDVQAHQPLAHKLSHIIQTLLDNQRMAV